MKKENPFKKRALYKKKNYEAEFILARESLVKSNLTVIALNDTIRSQKGVIVELQATIREHLETIESQQKKIDGDKHPIDFSSYIKTRIRGRDTKLRLKINRENK